MRQHGYSKRRTWRKIHVRGHSDTQDMEAGLLTEANVDDAEGGMPLLAATDGEIAQVEADGSYAQRTFYEASVARGV
ncbi:MAG: IS5 family transposase [Chloroflexi bacterium AL-W]|nr:IS5 family transposase [Chloroflexi bacterium AL-N5]NOK85415.1 IS5 family transposase [Chloroflexi bacterium AL-W]